MNEKKKKEKKKEGTYSRSTNVIFALTDTSISTKY